LFQTMKHHFRPGMSCCVYGSKRCMGTAVTVNVCGRNSRLFWGWPRCGQCG
jgi:hypothetical protein